MGPRPGDVQSQSIGRAVGVALRCRPKHREIRPRLGEAVGGPVRYLMQRAGDEVLRALARVVSSDEPVQRLWELKLSSSPSELMSGLASLGKSNERLRAEAIRYSEHLRGMQSSLIAGVLERRQIEPTISPMSIAL
jgi:hypothetical protein